MEARVRGVLPNQCFHSFVAKVCDWRAGINQKDDVDRRNILAWSTATDQWNHESRWFWPSWCFPLLEMSLERLMVLSSRLPARQQWLAVLWQWCRSTASLGEVRFDGIQEEGPYKLVSTTTVAFRWSGGRTVVGGTEHLPYCENTGTEGECVGDHTDRMCYRR